MAGAKDGEGGGAAPLTPRLSLLFLLMIITSIMLTECLIHSSLDDALPTAPSIAILVASVVPGDEFGCRCRRYRSVIHRHFSHYSLHTLPFT